MFTIEDKADWFKKKKKLQKTIFYNKSIDHISSFLYKWSYGKYTRTLRIYKYIKLIDRFASSRHGIYMSSANYGIKFVQELVKYLKVRK